MNVARDARVAVVGLGKIGLPLAVQYASRGLSVVGCDVDADVVVRINAADCPVVGEEGLADGLTAALDAGLLRATGDTSEGVRESDVVVIIVPVGLTPGSAPDFSHLDAAVEAVRAGVRPGTLVVVESTVPVGTTRGRVGMALGDGVLLAASPERVFSGRVFEDLRTYPKLIGPLDEASWSSAESFYSAALEAPWLLRLRDPETAEFAKLAEGLYRDLNIALADELARYADSLGIDVTEAIEAANSQSYSHLLQPGVGVGGHCLPVYPHFLPASAGLRLPAAAREINDAMASYGVAKLEGALGSLKDATVLILGLGYRPNVKEAAHSSALLLAEALRERGARPLVHDSLFSEGEIRALGLEPPGEFPTPGVDAIILQAAHSAYAGLDFASFAGCRAVLDGRNALDRAAVEATGMRYLGIGR
ncbi:MAG: nucleotide sugar dehydrogenase [Dehalococcoidia bacterium]